MVKQLPATWFEPEMTFPELADLKLLGLLETAYHDGKCWAHLTEAGLIARG